MKTLEQINFRINDILAENALIKNDIMQQKKNRTEIKILKECKLYLETSPSEAFIKQMLLDSEQRLKRVNKLFKKWLPEGMVEKEGRKEYDKLMNTKLTKSQIKRLKFLLS